MIVPFLDLRAAYLELKQEIDAAVARALESGWYILGEEVDRFEESFAAYCGAAHCVGVANGLDALHLALLAVGVGRDDEVIVPSNTYIATWLAVSMCGARPVPVEPDETTFNIDPDKIEAAITSHTKAILPVHLYGQPADLAPILAVAQHYGLKVIEDAAQAHGAEYRSKRLGAHGDAVAWSYYPGKNLGAMGDGGAVTTDNPEIDDKIRMLRNYGSRRKYVNEVRGVNSRLDPVQAALLGVKLAHLDAWNMRRNKIAEIYAQGLEGTQFTLPRVPNWASPVWQVYVVRHPRRDAVQQYLQLAGIGTLIHYPIPPHLQDAYKSGGRPMGEYPIAARLAGEVLSIPMGPHLAPVDAHKVVEALKRADSECGQL